DLSSPVGTFFRRNDANVGRFGGNCCTAAESRSLRSWRRGADGIRNQFDMRRCSSTTATNKLRARLYEALGKLRHVFRRTHVKLPALHVARQARVWLG